MGTEDNFEYGPDGGHPMLDEAKKIADGESRDVLRSGPGGVSRIKVTIAQPWEGIPDGPLRDAAQKAAERKRTP